VPAGRAAAGATPFSEFNFFGANRSRVNLGTAGFDGYDFFGHTPYFQFHDSTPRGKKLLVSDS
jgi:hypothetical protein